jgi:uncharacterized protein YjiS (DUF1127 family)
MLAQRAVQTGFSAATSYSAPTKTALPSHPRTSEMNLLAATVLLLTRDRSRKLSVAHLDDRLLNDIGLCRLDFHGGRAIKKTA